MSKQSERLHTAIVQIAEEMHVNMFEATLILCERDSIDPEDITKLFDDVTLQRIKQSAIEENMVRKQVVGIRDAELPLE
jgi:hypothetical protein